MFVHSKELSISFGSWLAEPEFLFRGSKCKEKAQVEVQVRGTCSSPSALLFVQATIGISLVQKSKYQTNQKY